VLAYRVGTECAVDRLLLTGDASGAADVNGWKVPKLPIGGGILIARGVPEGPAVARALRQIEDRWVEAGFPRGGDFDRIVTDTLAAAQR
jgi:poly(A) polymerase